MKKGIIYLSILLSLNGCTQNTKVMINQNKGVTSENIVNEILKQIKHYDIEKVYKISYENYYCYFEVFVNNYPVYKEFDSPLTGSAFEINSASFQNGPKKITYRMYPVGKVEDQDTIYSTFPDITYLKLTLKSYDAKNENADDIIYSEYRTPSTRAAKTENPYDSIDKFEGAGKTYYEGVFTINTDVPYKLHDDFLKAQDLRKMDPKILEDKLLKEYQKIKEIYINKDLDNIAKLCYDKLFDEIQGTYDTEKVLKLSWEAIVKNVSSPSFEVQPIENYKMEFFADGRLVALMSKSQDKVLRGEPALWAKYRDEDGLQAYTMKHYFYIPQGETAFKVY